MALLATIIMTGFFLILGTSFLLTNTLTKQKDLQIQAMEVLRALDLVEIETRNLLLKRSTLESLQSRWLTAISSFLLTLDSLALMGADSNLSSLQMKQLRDALELWKQTYQWYYIPAINHLRLIINRGVGDIVGEAGIFFTLKALETKSAESGKFQATGGLLTMQNYIVVIGEETSSVVLTVTNLKESLQEQTETTIRNARNLSLVVILLVLVLTLFLTIRFSHLLVNRIYKVGEAMKQIANGNFSSDLNIQSKDEFQDLSKDYNILKNQLQAKLNSMLNFMLTVTTILEEDPNLQNILSIILSATVENTSACGAAVYLIDAEEDTLIPQSSFGYYSPPFPLPPEVSSSEKKALAYARENRIPIGVNTIGIAVKETRPLFIRSVSALDGGEFDFARPQEDPLCIESLIIVPLMIARRLLGAIVITKRPSNGTFTDMDFTHMQTFADYAALTIDNLYNTEELIERRELRREVSIAADIQRQLLPKTLPKEVSVFSRAARGISGDYYDAFPMGEGKIGVIICDVVGKGVPASLMMVMIRTIILLVSNHQRIPAKLLTFLNKSITGIIGTEQFATMGIFCYDEDSRTITYANAAHPPLLLYRFKEGAFLEVDTSGLPIGVEQKERYREKSFPVEIGDVLIFFTDGLSEARSPDGREYTTERIKSRLSQCNQKSAKEICQSIREDVDNFTAGIEQHDDQTLIVMKVLK